MLNSYGPSGATDVYHAFHGKRTEDWLLPKPLPGYENVNDRVLDKIGAQIEEIFTQIHGRLRLSDSPGLADEVSEGANQTSCNGSRRNLRQLLSKTHQERLTLRYVEHKPSSVSAPLDATAVHKDQMSWGEDFEHRPVEMLAFHPPSPG